MIASTSTTIIYRYFLRYIRIVDEQPFEKRPAILGLFLPRTREKERNES